MEGQNFEIRKTLWRYASVVEKQRRTVMARRQAVLHGLESSDIWRVAPQRRAALVAEAGEDAVRRAGVAILLFHIDQTWRDHLAYCAELREGIHLVTLGGHDPLTRFTSETLQMFRGMEDAIDKAVLDTLERVRVKAGQIDLDTIGIKGPSSTWTYLVNDDPFRNQIGMMLTGPGRTTIAIYSAVLWPLLLLWGLLDRFVRRRPRRRADRFRD